MQNKKADKEKEEVSAEPESTDGSSYITYNGKKYKYNSDLRTMLFMGVDKNEVVTVKENTGRSGQSDCLVLLVLDTDKKDNYAFGNIKRFYGGCEDLRY